jgi:hypothetical protein
MQQAFGLDIPTTLADVCDPKSMALLVYDMQVGILRQLPTAAQTISRVVDVLNAARDGGFRTLFTRHTSLPNELAGSMQLRTAMAWQHVASVDGVRPAFPLVPALADDLAVPHQHRTDYRIGMGRGASALGQLERPLEAHCTASASSR